MVIYLFIYCLNYEFLHFWQGGTQSQGTDKKSSNPFDLPYDSDLEQSSMVCHRILILLINCCHLYQKFGLIYFFIYFYVMLDFYLFICFKLLYSKILLTLLRILVVIHAWMVTLKVKDSGLLRVRREWWHMLCTMTFKDNYMLELYESMLKPYCAFC